MKHVKHPKIRKALVFLGAISPIAFFIADKIGHAFGICLGG